MKTIIVFFLSLIITNFATSQSVTNYLNDKWSEIDYNEKKYNGKQKFNITLTQGFSYNKNHTNFHYINLFIIRNHSRLQVDSKFIQFLKSLNVFFAD